MSDKYRNILAEYLAKIDLADELYDFFIRAGYSKYSNLFVHIDLPEEKRETRRPLLPCLPTNDEPGEGHS